MAGVRDVEELARHSNGNECDDDQQLVQAMSDLLQASKNANRMARTLVDGIFLLAVCDVVLLVALIYMAAR